MSKFAFIFLVLIFPTGIYALERHTIIDDEVTNKCGTFFSQEQKNHILNLLSIRDSTMRPVQKERYTSPSGLFVIHYDISGINAVDLTDENHNGIPDFVDSAAYYFDYAYKVEIDSLGYRIPPSDSGLGGSDAYDVYLLDIGNGSSMDVAYGFTTPEIRVQSTSKFPCFTSFIIIDNNFSPRDSMTMSDTTKKKTYLETGIEALKITSAHEFHHAIQLAYGEEPSTPSLNELSSTYMEHRLHPETVDYIQFVRSLFKNLAVYNFGDGYYGNGYRYSIFGQYMYKNYGDSLMKRMWELISTGYTGFDALDLAFRERKSTLSDEWRKFIPWLYYTGERAVAGEFFEQAAIFPQLSYYIDTFYSAPSFSSINTMKPFEIRAIRCKFIPDDPAKTNDTLDIVMVNTDLKSADNPYGENQLKQYKILCTADWQTNALQIGNTKYYYTFSSDSGLITDSLYINAGFLTNILSYCYPNPYRRDFDDALYFPAPLRSSIGDKALLRIFTTSMKCIFEQSEDIMVNKRDKIIMLKGLPAEISEGVYLFSVKWQGEETFGKMSVIK